MATARPGVTTTVQLEVAVFTTGVPQRLVARAVEVLEEGPLAGVR